LQQVVAGAGTDRALDAGRQRIESAAAVVAVVEVNGEVEVAGTACGHLQLESERGEQSSAAVKSSCPAALEAGPWLV